LRRDRSSDIGGRGGSTCPWVVSDERVRIIDKSGTIEVQPCSRATAGRDVAFEVAMIPVNIICNPTTSSSASQCIDLAATLYTIFECPSTEARKRRCNVVATDVVATFNFVLVIAHWHLYDREIVGRARR
jgi:hypothetical protein